MPEDPIDTDLEDENEDVPFWPNFKRVLKVLYFIRYWAIATLVSSLINSILSLGEDYYGGNLVDTFFINNQNEYYRVFYSMVILYTSQAINHGLHMWLRSKVENRSQNYLQLQFFNALIHKKQVSYFDIAKSGQLSTHISSTTGDATWALCYSIPRFFTITGEVGLALAYMIATDWKLSAIILAMLPFVGVISWTQNKWEQPLNLKYTNATGKFTGFVTEVLHNIRTIRIFNIEKYISKAFAKIQNSKNIIHNKLNIAGALSDIMWTVSFNTASIFCVWYGGQLVMDGKLTAGQFLSFTLMASSLASKINEIPYLLTDVNRLLASTERIFSVVEDTSRDDITLKNNIVEIREQYGLLEEEQKPVVLFTPPSSHIVTGRLELIKVCFNYPSRPSQKILLDFTLTVNSGQKVALVGHSGSGKSTITSILSQLYQPTSGTITLDGLDLSTLDPKWLRQQIGFVSQDPVLFNGTIRENIALGLASTDEDLNNADYNDMDKLRSLPDGLSQIPIERIESAAKLSNAHEFIMKMPQGYNTKVGERGTLLSVGQRQRIAIARVLLKNPKVLIADEATSALDNESERLVQQALEVLMEDRTSIIVAHRLSTIRNCNPICVIDKGVIVEMGSHEELIEKGCVYASLINAGEIDKSRESKSTPEPELDSDQDITEGIPNSLDHSPKQRIIGEDS